MANTIIIKNGAGAPPNNALTVAELGFDTQNKKLYIGTKDGAFDLISSGMNVNFEESAEGETNVINAGSLGGILAENYATKSFVNSSINEILGVIENGSY